LVLIPSTSAVYDEVGFIHVFEQRDGTVTPCCVRRPDEFIKQNPNTFVALYRAVSALFMASGQKTAI
jgi:nitrate/nitrite transport system substrate-binding protein